ncbi:solute carrier family 25 member 45-like [Glandiceps talaboti]
MSADFIAGLVGGGTGVFVGYPLDTIKTRLQAQSLATHKYRGILDCMITTFKNETVFGFYKGMGFPLATIALQNAVTFGVYGNVLRHLSEWKGRDWNQNPENIDIYIAGCAGGVVQLSIACPIELVKIRLQMQTHGRGNPIPGQTMPIYRGPIHCIATIFKNEGIRGCYRGLTVLTLRDVPSFGIYFLAYDVFCRKLTFEGQNHPSTWALLLAGGAAGSISWGIINPLDVIKSRLQGDGVKSSKYHNLWHCVVDSYKTGGIKVFFTGMSINCVRGFPVNAATFAVYSLILRVLNGQDKTHTN